MEKSSNRADLGQPGSEQTGGYRVQPLVFGGREGNEELYFRGPCWVRDGRLVIPVGNTVELDTYFNLFSIKQWAEWTRIERVSVGVRLAGAGKVSLLGLAESGETFLIREERFDALNASSDIWIWLEEDRAIRDFPPFCFLKIEARSEVQILNGGLFTDLAPANPVKLACCFCTYRREKEIVRNVNRLVGMLAEQRESPLFGKLDVFVADNGHTLKREDFASSDSVILMENPNYGGSAGFARCMMEAALGPNRGNYTHLILMDDDAVIQPFVVERTAFLLSYLKEECRRIAVGGAMLSLQEPWMQLENGAVWAVHKPEVRGYDVDLRDRQVLIHNQEGRMNYNGWFLACFPASFVTEKNLPLPFFIHGDDIGYGLRNKAGWIHMNGICIWHPNPQIARRPYMLYYDSRNYKVVNNEHLPDRKALQVALTDFRILLALACQYRYEDCAYQIRGTRDYLKGPDWFVKQNPEQLNREIMGWMKYEECRIGMEDIQIQEARFIPKRKLKTVLAWLLPANRKRAVYDQGAGWDKIWMFRTREYCIVDETTGKGIILRKSYRKWLRVMGQAAGTAVRILLRYGRASAAWKQRIPEMSSEAFWNGYLGIRNGMPDKQVGSRQKETDFVRERVSEAATKASSG